MSDRVVSDSVLEKAGRLLVDGKLEVTFRDGDKIVATCLGDSGEKHSLQSSGGVGLCSCPAVSVCSHLLALAMVTGNQPE